MNPATLPRLAIPLLALLPMLLLRTPPAASAQPAEQPELWQLKVTAQPVPRPALAHALLVHPVDQIPGNAAPLYLMAMAEARRVEIPRVDPADLARRGLPATDEQFMMYYFIALPIEQIPVNELDAFLKPYGPALAQLDAATHREHCNWELPLRELGFETALPYLGDARHLTNVASLRARLHAARNEHAEAARAIRAIFQMGRHIADGGLFIQSLVGVGLADVGVDRVKELLARPAAPNLYWPLANLPRPYASLRDAIQWERVGLLASLPSLRKIPQGKPFTSADWADFTHRQSRLGVATSLRDVGFLSLDTSFGAAGTGALLYPEAKRYLLANGVPPADVDALPVPEALGRYVYGEYQSTFDDIARWSGLPYWQARAGMDRALANAFAPTASVPVQSVSRLIPSVARAATQLTRLDARVAALQLAEALRAYAAKHDGKFPSSLAELTDADTPAPSNPFTGEPFGYRLDGATAVIDLPPPPGEPARRGLRIELTIVK